MTTTPGFDRHLHLKKTMLLSSDPAARKAMPIATGVLDYFPLAIAEVSTVSKTGNDQHNPGQALHWDKTKSLDHADCIARHLIDRGSRDTDGMRHSAKLAWRALALLQTELDDEAELAKTPPLPPFSDSARAELDELSTNKRAGINRMIDEFWPRVVARRDEINNARQDFTIVKSGTDFEVV